MTSALRASKAGLGYEVEKKMEANYDREEQAGTPQAIVNWTNAILNGKHEPCPGSGIKDIGAYFKSGVPLCKLINELLASEGKPPIPYQKKVMSPFVALTNLENFAKGCENYGLSKECTVQSTDVHECRKAGLYNFINTMHSLGFLANSKGYMPAYTGEIVKYLDNE
ncbi:rac guanine nucleotide exchange factor B-like [Liolophura sinensis]|uniref:rac guanine nucleotide exchange factor B-like n=1 Tax=Liolophura sinensis TaxID=3198878 RepID=UPI0031592522